MPQSSLSGPAAAAGLRGRVNAPPSPRLSAAVACVVPASIAATLAVAVVACGRGGIAGPRDTRPPPADDATPTFVTAHYIDLGAVGRISRFRSAVGHDYSDDFETCRSMKHYFEPRAGIDPTRIAIFAPVDGTVAELREEWAGTQVGIQAAERPAFTLVVFHVHVDPPLAVGDRVRAGQRLGTHIGPQTMSDIAVREATPHGMRLVSYFEVLSDARFAEVAALGPARRADAIIGAAERDRRPLRCQGDRFLDPPGDADWLILRPRPTTSTISMICHALHPPGL